MLCLNEYLARKQEIGMLRHGSGQRILDRNDGGGHRFTFHAFENLRRSCARYHRTPRQHTLGCLVTKGPEFSLDGNLHVMFPGQGKLSGDGTSAPFSLPPHPVNSFFITSASTPFE